MLLNVKPYRQQYYSRILDIKVKQLLNVKTLQITVLTHNIDNILIHPIFVTNETCEEGGRLLWGDSTCMVVNHG